MRRFVQSIALFTLVSCAPSPSQDTDDVTDTEIGVMDTCPAVPSVDWLSEPGLEPLAEGDTVVMAHGPQGGWHIALNAGIQGNRTLLLHPFVELLATGEQIAGEDNAYELPLWDWDAETCDGTMAGMIAYLDDLPDVNQEVICGFVGQQMRVRLLVTDPEGLATDELSVVVVAEADPSDDCG